MSPKRVILAIKNWHSDGTQGMGNLARVDNDHEATSMLDKLGRGGEVMPSPDGL